MSPLAANPLGRNAPNLLFLLVQRQTILLVNGEALQLNGLKSDFVYRMQPIRSIELLAKSHPVLQYYRYLFWCFFLYIDFRNRTIRIE
jgi:hypothetical protein